MIPFSSLTFIPDESLFEFVRSEKNYQATASNNGLLCMYALCSLLLFCGKNLESSELIQEVRSKLIDKLKFWTESMLISMKLSLKVKSFVSFYSYFEPFRIIRNISTTYLNQYNLLILIELFRISDKQANLKKLHEIIKKYFTCARYFVFYKTKIFYHVLICNQDRSKIRSLRTWSEVYIVLVLLSEYNLTYIKRFNSDLNCNRVTNDKNAP